MLRSRTFERLNCIFDICIINAGSPGRANQHISYQNTLNNSARKKQKRYKAAPFCPLTVTVEGIAHQSMQAFLGRIAAWLSAKWQKPLSTVTKWVRVRVQFALIKAVDLRTRGSGRSGGARGSRMVRGMPLSSRDSGVCCIPVWIVCFVY